jgi:hypothetical protein
MAKPSVSMSVAMDFLSISAMTAAVQAYATGRIRLPITLGHGGAK